MTRPRFINTFLIRLLFFPCIVWGAPSIHVIGDSHSWEFRGIPGCMEHYLGPVTMHRMGRDRLDAAHFSVNPGDAVVLAFGEIDVRCHIGRQRDHNERSLDEIIYTLATNYLEQIASAFPNINLIVYSVTPPSDIVNNREYPIYGSLEDRVNITQLLNQALKLLAPRYGIDFLDVYDDYADEQGVLCVDLSDHNVHIHPAHNGAIRNKLFEILEKK